MEARSLQRWWWRWWSAWRPSSCSSWRPSCCGTRRSGSAAAGSSPSRARWSAAAAGSSQRWRNTPEVTQCNHLQICQKLQPITPTLDPARILGTFNDFYSSTVFGIVLSRTKYCYLYVFLRIIPGRWLGATPCWGWGEPCGHSKRRTGRLWSFPGMWCLFFFLSAFVSLRGFGFWILVIVISTRTS